VGGGFFGPFFQNRPASFSYLTIKDNNNSRFVKTILYLHHAENYPFEDNFRDGGEVRFGGSVNYFFWGGGALFIHDIKVHSVNVFPLVFGEQSMISSEGRKRRCMIWFYGRVYFDNTLCCNTPCRD